MKADNFLLAAVLSVILQQEKTFNLIKQEGHQKLVVYQVGILVLVGPTAEK